jgi:outer membrane protein assembly factor BamB
MRRIAWAVAAAGCVFVAFAQRGVDWVVGSNDAHRSSWVRMDAKINAESMKKPGFELLWKMKMNGMARQTSSLTPPSLLDFYIGYRGFRSLGFVGTASGTVTGIDIDLARVEWEKTFATPGGPSTAACPGGITSGVVRPVTTLNYPAPVGGSGIGRGTPAKSGAGMPDEGAVTLKRPPPSAPPPPPPTRPGTRAGAPVNLFAPRVQYAHFITGDGKFHSLYVSNGDEPKPAVDFLPAGAHAQGLMVFERVAYVTTVNGCGGAANGLWALDLETNQVQQWKTSNVVGTVGAAMGPDGTIYVAGEDEIVALELKTLAVKAKFKASNAKFTSSPVVFDFKGKDLLAVTSNDGALQIFDTANLGKLLTSSPVFSSKDFAAGALASWQDMSGVRWILAPAGAHGANKNGSVTAWKVAELQGGVALQPGWTSRDMVLPSTPAIVNGVVFALSRGDARTKAVLYALDATTGKDVWNSGTTIASYVTTGRLAAGGSRIYVGTHDATQYAFGFPIEH